MNIDQALATYKNPRTQALLKAFQTRFPNRLMVKPQLVGTAEQGTGDEFA